MIYKAYIGLSLTRLDTSSELLSFPVHVRSIGPTVEGREEIIYKAYIGLSLTRLDTSSELSPFPVHVRSIGPTVDWREEMIYKAYIGLSLNRHQLRAITLPCTCQIYWTYSRRERRYDI